MSILGNPDYNLISAISNDGVHKLKDCDFLLSYMVLDVEFEFPCSVKYPCIPTRVDDNIDIYPLTGRSVITGSEYLVARNMGCRLTVLDGLVVPFKKSEESTDPKSLNDEFDILYDTPFRNIIQDLQAKRRREAKKSFHNLMYKQIGNSIYGQVSMGLSGKRRFDIKTQTFVRVHGGSLSNPLLASYITGFTRALIGECLQNINDLGGVVVSATTDGFITNLEGLEEKLLTLPNVQCLRLFRSVRTLLTSIDEEPNPSALEVKNIEDQSLLSWKTRGQLGLTDGGVSAATGFQTRGIPRDFLHDVFCNCMKEGSSFEYIQNSLRTATDIYKKGGHMSMVYKDRLYSMSYDNKRVIQRNDNKQRCDVSMLDSKP